METDEITRGNIGPNTSLVPRLKDFKERFCDENILIADALRNILKQNAHAPILDVGAGLGDIALACFPDVPATLLDTEPWSAPTSPLHHRAVGDFFEFARANRGPVGTLLLCHVMQYIDDDQARLRRAVAALKAQAVITVLNDNTGVFGELIEWAPTHINGANPEWPIVPVDMVSYKVTAEEHIAATMICPSFEIMAEFFSSMLLDADDDPRSIKIMEDRLRASLTAPSIIINQTITCYERHD